MSLITVNYFSSAMKRTVAINVYLPMEKNTDESTPQFKTLYLLHGIFGNGNDWITHSNILRYASEANIAVVMPSGENSFYIDNKDTDTLYKTFIGHELPLFMQKMFPLSNKRADTFIAGLSMGGFGALNIGLEYRDRFSKIGAFSPAIPNDLNATELFKGIDFGISYERVLTVHRDQLDILRHFKDDSNLPSIYITCGSEDFVLNNATWFANQLTNRNIDHTFKVWPGDHNWIFWDESIVLFLDTLPL